MPASDYTYWLGKEKEDLKWIGKRGLHRLDADDKATGKAIFGRDVKLPGMLYARIMMSPYARAKIKSMDTSEAEKLPGVRAVLRYDDPIIPKRIFNPWDPDIGFTAGQATPYAKPMYILGPEAFFEGAPLGVAIAADDLDIVDEAMELVKVEWEVLPFNIDYEKALDPGTPIVYDYMTEWDPNWLFGFRYAISSSYADEEFTLEPGWSGAENASNMVNKSTGYLPGTDLEAGFAEADKTIEFTFKRTESKAVSPEILSTIAQWTDNGMLEIFQHSQDGIKKMFDVYALMMDMPKNRFLHHNGYAGGSFGGQTLYLNCFHCQLPIAAFLAKKTGAPVKVLYKRQDNQFGEMDEGKHHAKVGFKNDGTITAVQTEGLFAQCGDLRLITDTFGVGHLLSCTKIPNLEGTGTTVNVNKHAFGAHRCEQQIPAHYKQEVYSHVAAECGVDEGTIAKVNDGKGGHGLEYLSEYRHNNNIPDVNGLDLVLEAAKDAVNFDEKFHTPGERKLPNGKYHGMCLAPHHEFSNGANPPAPDPRSLKKMMLSCNYGQVHITGLKGDVGVDMRTGICRAIADELGMNFEDVIYSHLDESTESRPETWLSGGGASLTFSGHVWTSVALARLLKIKILAFAAIALEANAEDLDIVDSNVVFKDDPSNATPFGSISSLHQITATIPDVVMDWGKLDIPSAPSPAGLVAGLYMCRSCNILEVEVDPETGGVEIVNAVAVNDVGLAVGPETCEGQAYGGAIMGYSTGSIEEQIYDPGTGVRLNPNFIDYKILTLADIPNIEGIIVESRMGTGPYGSCGIGEDNTTFCSSMVTAAIHNAIGKWVDTYPPTPERVLKALGKA